MSNEFEKVYIGDGVYARWDGITVLLETERDSGTHYIYLESQHVESLARLIASEPRIAKAQRGARISLEAWGDEGDVGPEGYVTDEQAAEMVQEAVQPIQAEADRLRAALVKIASMNAPWDGLGAAKAIALVAVNESTNPDSSAPSSARLTGKNRQWCEGCTPENCPGCFLPDETSAAPAARIAADEPMQIKCPKCEKAVNYVYCPYCGAEQDTEPSAAPAARFTDAHNALNLVDMLLVEAGYAQDSSVRHNLAIAKSIFNEAERSLPSATGWKRIYEGIEPMPSPHVIQSHQGLCVYLRHEGVWYWHVLPALPAPDSTPRPE